VSEVRRADQAAPEPVPEKLDYPPLTVIRRSDRGWRVDDEELPDLLSAIVLADLLAPELRGASSAADDSPVLATDGSPAPSPSVSGRSPDGDSSGADRSFRAAGDGQGAVADDACAEAVRLRVTVSQLEHALATRVRVEQAIGIVSERRRVPARQAFELLRTVARADGTRLAELAARVVDSVVNPLLPLPEELARPPRPPRARGRSPRHIRASE
jgi:hypothetical protein